MHKTASKCKESEGQRGKIGAEKLYPKEYKDLELKNDLALIPSS